MGQAYGAAFARLYDLRWAGFAKESAPVLREFHLRTADPDLPLRLLDLCCGTGQVARHFLDAGFAVTGVDLSAGMLERARVNAGHYLASGAATFVQADATDFELAERFGLVVSTYDALNHLPDLAALRSCLASVARVTLPGGRFLFDLNTRGGLYRWNGTTVHEEGSGPEDNGAFVVQRSHYDGGDRAETLLTGFVPSSESGCYERFDEAVYNTVFDLVDVARVAAETGWAECYFARLEDLDTPLAEPELEGRVFVVATRSG
jgi:SAM-dependent methyltransferase